MPDPGLVPASYLALLIRRCQRQTGRLKVEEGTRFFCLLLAPFCDILAVVSIPALIVCFSSHSGSHFAVQTAFLELVWLDSFGTRPSWQAPVLWDLGPSSEASLTFWIIIILTSSLCSLCPHDESCFLSRILVFPFAFSVPQYLAG